MSDNAIKQVANTILKADALLITAGAGIGVDSGLPDYRGTEGFWKAYPPLKKLSLSYAKISTSKLFDSNPKLAWGFYGHQLELYRNVVPHQGFMQLLKIVEQKKGGYFVFTSNIDGQFQKAGYDPDRVLECHGSIHHLQCTKPCTKDIWPTGMLRVEVVIKALEALRPLPRCKHCAGLARPNVMMFDDAPYLNGRCDKQYDRYIRWQFELQEKNYHLAIIEIGAGITVSRVRAQSENMTRKFNATLIRINTRHPEVMDGNFSISLGAADAINQLNHILQQG